MTKKETGSKSTKQWIALLASLISVVAVATAASLVKPYSQQAEEPPEGYLGPMVPIPVEGDPNAVPGDPDFLDPAILPNVLINDKVDDAPDRSQSETTIAVDPTNPLRLVGGFNDCRGFFVPSRNGVSGWGFSVDGGATWTGVQTGLPKFAPADFGSRGDPSIDVDSAGNYYYASLYQRAGVGQLLISVHKGRFVGSTFTWDTPTFATAPPVNADKEHLGVDKTTGDIYVSYTNFGVSPRTIEVVRSTDGGQTWSAPVVLASGDVQGSVPRIGPDGEIYVVWATWPGIPRTLRIRKSTRTMWPTFGPEVSVVTMTPAANPPSNSRNPQFPGMDIDRTTGPNRGRVYLTFDDGRFGGPGQIGTILLVHSPDGSAGSWSAPIRLDDDPQPPSMTGTHRWFSWPAVDARGVVHIGWYDRRLRPMPPGNQTLTDIFATEFRVGMPPSANVRLTSQSYPMNVPSACTPNFGDYNGSAVGPGQFHFLYGDGRLGNPDTFTAGETISPILAEPATAEACRNTPATTTIRVLGGTGSFENPVALSLTEVNPPEATITATFNPNPVPTPPPAGNTSQMTINTTGETPPGTYRLTVEGFDGTVRATVDVTLIVRSQAPTAPVLLEPLNDADGVLETTTFRWEAAEQATTYRLEIFLGGTRVRLFDNIVGTQFTIPAAQALDFFQSYTWRVTAKNTCGETVSAETFSFRTLSCSVMRDFTVNGGFEQDLAGWFVDARIPPPVPSTLRPRTGSQAAKLGVIAEQGTATIPGDSEIHQTFNIPAMARNPRLSFWFWPQSSDAVANDQQEVFVTPISPPGPTVVLMRVARNDRAYVRQEFSLAAFRGSTIEIHFRVRNGEDTNPTGMFLDDVAVELQSCGLPDFFLTTVGPPIGEVCAGGSVEFRVSVDSLNGPNFTSAVNLNAVNLPPNTTAVFEQNPLLPGQTTRMTLFTDRPIRAGVYLFDVVGEAVEPPPAEPRLVRTSISISSNATQAPELISPLNGEVNVARRPTLSWTEPFAEDLAPTAPTSLTPAGVDWTQVDWLQMIGNRPPDELPPGTPPPGGGALAALSAGNLTVDPTVFGAARYRVQVARDPDFTDLVLDMETADTVLTVPTDLAIATQYYWRVQAINACGLSPWSAVQSFVVGACFETWSVRPPVPIPNGTSQTSVIAFGTRFYLIGGGIGPGPADRIRQMWEFDSLTDAWTRKADIPAGGPGAVFGSVAEVGGKIYVFGGVSPNPVTILNTLFIYDIATDTWSRGRDLPTANFGAAVAAIGGKIYAAYGSGFGQQTWEYDPTTDMYTRKADAPATANFRLHGDALGSEMHAFAGGFGGTAHVIYNAATNTWRTGPPMPFGVTDPGVTVVGGKFYVIGGRPIARTQIFDPGTNTWSQGARVPDLPAGVDNTDADAIGFTIHLAGGFDGVTSINAHRSFDVCGATSSLLIPYVADGDGTAAGVANESTSLLMTNVTSGPVSAHAFLHGTGGAVAASRTFSVGPNALLNIDHVIREMKGETGVQNVEGSLAIFATRPFQAMAQVFHNATGDSTIVEGQPLVGARNGFVPAVQLTHYRTHTAFANVSSRTANVQMLAYPPGGGGTPVASGAFSVPAHGMVDFADTVSQLGLPAGHIGQLSWNADQSIATTARDVTLDDGYSGTQPERGLTDGARSLVIANVEDNETYQSKLQVSNTGPVTANATVRFVDVADLSGSEPGTNTTRDIPVPRNSATVIQDVIRWVLRDEGGMPTGKRGFLVVTSPQIVTATAAAIHTGSLDPAIADSARLLTRGFTTTVLKFDPDRSSRIAISNSGTTAAAVELLPINADGSPALPDPFVVSVVGGGQFFTEDIAGTMGLPSPFVGWMVVNASAPVAIYNQAKSGNTGAVLPARPR